MDYYHSIESKQPLGSTSQGSKVLTVRSKLLVKLSTGLRH